MTKIIQRVHRTDEGPIRETLAGGFNSDEGAVRHILSHLPDNTSYKAYKHNGNKRTRVVIGGRDLFYEIVSLNDIDLIENDPWPLPEKQTVEK